MKKRSLFAAVAMLIVSAIVLTSATYAWFASSAKAKMDTISASISNTNGGLQISLDQSTWTDELKTSDFTGEYAVTDTLVPVSADINPTTHAITFCGGDLAGKTFTAKAATATDYVHYKIYCRAQVAGYLNVPCTLNFNGLEFGRAYILAAKTGEGGVTTYLGNPVQVAINQGTTYPTTASSGTATDKNGNAIIDTTGSEAGTVTLNTTGVQYTASGTNNVFAGLNSNQGYQMAQGDVIWIDVWVWAEGQDTSCSGGLSSTAITSKLVFNFSGDPTETTTTE